MHVVHVRGARADVFGGDVPSAERLDEAAVRAKEELATHGLVVANDDGLPASEIQSGDCVLVRHAPRKPQRVDDGFVVGGVTPEPCSAERGSENGAVDRDDAAISGSGIVAEGYLLVPHARNRVENLHVEN